MQDVITFIAKHQLLSLAIAIVFILAMIIEFIRARRQTYGLNPSQVIQKINRDNAVIIDIRPVEPFRNGHIIDAVAMTEEEIYKNSKKLEKFKIRPVIIIGQTGTETQKVAAFLVKQGYNAYFLTGGMRAWLTAEFPIIRE